MKLTKSLGLPARIVLIALVVGVIVCFWFYSSLFFFNLYATSFVLWLTFPLYNIFIDAKYVKRVELALKIVSTILIIIFALDQTGVI